MNNTFKGIDLERIHRTLLLNAEHKDMVIAGIFGVMDHYSNFKDMQPAIEALTLEINKMLDTYEAEEDESEED